VRDAAEAKVLAMEEVARHHHQKFYNKVMLLYAVLASQEEREAIAKPNGWRPHLPTNVSLHSSICYLQALINVRFPLPSVPPP
jgi:hypothetical protein